MKKTLILSVAMFVLCGCKDGWIADFDPWGKASKENCDRYGNNCQPICTIYGNCGPAKEVRSCELYGNCE